MKVWPVGSTVILDSDIKGTILQICIGNEEAISYEIVWWDGNKRNKEWFQEFEIGMCDQPMQIGFHSPEKVT